MSEESPRETSDLLAERRAKLERLREAGIEPFPQASRTAPKIAVVRESHEGIEPGEETSDRYRVAGRLIARRGHGKAAFLDLIDGTGQIQVQARVDELGEAYEGLLALDVGDIVGIEGTVFASRRGELTIGPRPGSCSRSPCARRRRSSTASRTWRHATAAASST